MTNESKNSKVSDTFKKNILGGKFGAKIKKDPPPRKMIKDIEPKINLEEKIAKIEAPDKLSGMDVSTNTRLINLKAKITDVEIN